MGQKVNAKGFRLLKKKSWSNPSYISLFNYNLVMNQDLNIRKFINGFLSYLDIFHNFIHISRIKGVINILITVYNKDFWFKRHSHLFRYKKRLKKKLHVKKTKRSTKYSKKKSFFFNSVFRSFKLYKSLHNLRLSKKNNAFYSKLKRPIFTGLRKENNLTFNVNYINPVYQFFCLKYLSYKTSKKSLDYLGFKSFFFIRDNQKFSSCYNLGYNIKILNLLYLFSSVTYTSKKFKCFIIYSKLVYSFFITKLFLFTKKNLFLFIFKSSKLFPLLKEKKITSSKLAIVNESNLINRKWEGLSLKSLISLYVKKLTGILNVNVTFLYLNSPRKLYKFFNKLKLNVRARGNLRKEVFNLYLVLYQSFKFKSPNFFSLYFIILLKKNIKKVGQLFAILRFSLPSFCLLFGFKGVRFQLKGRINGARRSRIMQVQSGSIPLTTLSNNVYYSFNKVMTIHGIYGLKIWYYV